MISLLNDNSAEYEIQISLSTWKILVSLLVSLIKRHLLSVWFLVLWLSFLVAFKVSLVFCSFIAMYLVVGVVLVCLFNPC